MRCRVASVAGTAQGLGCLTRAVPARALPVGLALLRPHPRCRPQLSPYLQARLSAATLVPMALLGRALHPAASWAAGCAFAAGNAALCLLVAIATDAAMRMHFMRRLQQYGCKEP